MPNLSQVLKAEIARISRKEVKTVAGQIRAANSALRKNILELKKKVLSLEAENKRLSSFSKKELATQPRIDPEVSRKARVTSSGVRKLRARLGLSRDSFAKLLGMSSQNVYAMEKKDGRLKLRGLTLSKILSLRAMGKREVTRRLEEIGKDRQ